MKTNLLLLFMLALIGLCNNANAQWTWGNPLPQGNYLMSVHFVDDNNGYAIGVNGTLIRTLDAGVSWNVQLSGTSNDLLSVFFSSINTGYIVGAEGTILKTINGGVNWTIQSSGIENNLYAVHFSDANVGYVVGEEEAVLKTSNSGANWAECKKKHLMI